MRNRQRNRQRNRLCDWLVDDLVRCDLLHPYKRPEVVHSSRPQVLAARVDAVRLTALSFLLCRM